MTSSTEAEGAAPLHVLLVEDEPDLRSSLRYNLKRAGYVVSEASDGVEGLALATRIHAEGGAAIDVILTDVMMPRMDGVAMTKALRAMDAYREVPLLFLTAKNEPGDRLEGFRAGADDYVAKPFDLDELLARLRVQGRRARLTQRVQGMLTASRPAATTTSDLLEKVSAWEKRFPALSAIRARAIIGESEGMLSLLREILIRAPGNDPVLVSGETGSGKTGVAEALHALGPRSTRPFRVVSCAELAAADAAITLGKLFGYGKGSGLNQVAKEGQAGLLEDVDGGVLFLDEVHRLPTEAQAMLLLPIEGRPFHPAAGKGEPRTVDVKFIVATNVDLRAEAEAGRFPFDLYQRLAASEIRVPPLRSRRQDIPALAEHFLAECRDELGIPDAVLSPRLMRVLHDAAWPGNVRELRAVIREAARRAAFELESVLVESHLSMTWSGAGSSVESADTTSPNATLETATSAGLTTVEGAIRLDIENDGSGFWNEVEVRELAALRRVRFRIAAAEADLGLSSKSRTLTNHLRGLCFKALAGQGFVMREAASLVVGRADDALVDRMVDRMEGYLDVVEQHVVAATTKTLFNNLPRDYRKHVEAAIAHVEGKRKPA